MLRVLEDDYIAVTLFDLKGSTHARQTPLVRHPIMPQAALRKAVPCSRLNTTNGRPCGRDTTNPWGDCGQHGEESSGHAAVVNRDSMSRLGQADLTATGVEEVVNEAQPHAFIPTRIERQMLGEHKRQMLDIAMDENTREHYWEREDYSVAVGGHPHAGPVYQTRYRHVKKVRDQKWELPNDPEVTPQILTHLLLDPHEDVVRSVAQGKYTDDASREFCSTHESAAVRWDVARHPESTHRALSNLKDDPNHGVRVALVEREDLPDDIADHLKDDPSVDVKWALLNRRHLSIDVIEHMTRDGTRRIRRRARKLVKKRR